MKCTAPLEVGLAPDFQKQGSNVVKDLEGRWSRVVCCVKDEEFGRSIAEELSRRLSLSDYDDRFEIRLLERYRPTKGKVQR